MDMRGLTAGVTGILLLAGCAGEVVSPDEATPPAQTPVTSQPTVSAAAGIDAESQDVDTPSADQALRVAGQVDIVEHDGERQVCFVQRQGPSPCDSGVLVEGEIDWESIDGAKEGEDWVAADVWLVGDYADGTLTLTVPASLTQPHDVTLPAEPEDVAFVSEAEIQQARDAVLAAFSDELDKGLLNVSPRWASEGEQQQFDKGQLEVWLMVATPEIEAQVVDAAGDHIPAEAVVFKRYLSEVGQS